MPLYNDVLPSTKSLVNCRWSLIDIKIILSGNLFIWIMELHMILTVFIISFWFACRWSYSEYKAYSAVHRNIPWRSRPASSEKCCFLFFLIFFAMSSLLFTAYHLSHFKAYWNYFGRTYFLTNRKMEGHATYLAKSIKSYWRVIYLRLFTDPLFMIFSLVDSSFLDWNDYKSKLGSYSPMCLSLFINVSCIDNKMDLYFSMLLFTNFEILIHDAEN